MRTWPILLAAIGLLAACADQAPLPRLAARSALNCIALDRVAGRRIVDRSAVLFEMNGPVDYRSELPAACPGLTRLGPTATVSIASGGDGGQLCRGDRISLADPVEARATGLLNQPSCALGDFVAVSRRR
jgi:hypothetical protein